MKLVVALLIVCGSVWAQCSSTPFDMLLDQQTLVTSGPSDLYFGPLIADSQYFFVVTGTYSPNSGGGWYDAFGHYAPSEIYWYNLWWTWNGIYPHPSPDSHNAEHTYCFPFVSNGGTEHMSFRDNPYWDNSGALVFQLWMRAPGTTVCGDVSGVWDSTRSPYYVTCDVTVPAGQTLEIQPGVEVLFTGHYKFNVFGNLQAIGTEQDSIIFTRAFPTEESKWWGIKFSDSASDSSRLNFCSMSYGLSNGWPDEFEQWGGAVLCHQCSPTIRNCLFAHNYADGGGGLMTYLSSPLIEDCRFEHNEGGNGGAVHSLFGSPIFVRCVFSSNESGWNGGAVDDNESTNSRYVNCTFYGNTAVNGGGGIRAAFSAVAITNCVFFGNDASNVGPAVFADVQSEISLTYTDIEEGDTGTGNIDADPMFVDAANGDFHLLPSSPCIDSGDPNSPLDPDSTRADMGAFYYPHPVLVVEPESIEWGLQDIGADSVLEIHLTNNSVLACTVQSITLGTSTFEFDSTGLNGAVQGQTTFPLPITFAPSSEGSYLDTLTIVSHLVTTDTSQVFLSGQAAVIPMAVESLVVRRGSLNGAQLYWSPVTQTISGQPFAPNYYVVHGATSEEGPYTPFGVATTNSYLHPFIINTQERYFYRVEASTE